MATRSYIDLGAMQRILSGSPTPKTSYVDLGGVQEQETSAARGLFRVPSLSGLGGGGSFFSDGLGGS